MHRLLPWFAAGASLVAAPLAAQDDTVVESFELRSGEDLVTACSVPPENALYQTAKGFCLGYMTGAMQLYIAAAASPNVNNFVCPERVVPRAEMRQIFLDWAAAHPELMREPAVDTLLRAAVDAFPCD